ncbi:MAG: hypothetical protein ACP5GI_08405 [Sulfolobales archaeon]
MIIRNMIIRNRRKISDLVALRDNEVLVIKVKDTSSRSKVEFHDKGRAKRCSVASRHFKY